jgi:hypothetical protein
VTFSTKGSGRSEAAVQHERLPDAPTAEKTKTFWRARLAALKALLENNSGGSK